MPDIITRDSHAVAELCQHVLHQVGWERSGSDCSRPKDRLCVSLVCPAPDRDLSSHSVKTHIREYITIFGWSALADSRWWRTLGGAVSGASQRAHHGLPNLA